MKNFTVSITLSQWHTQDFEVVAQDGYSALLKGLAALEDWDWNWRDNYSIENIRIKER